MAVEIRLLLGLFCLLTVAFGGTVANDKVPVIMWCNDKSVAFPPVFAGHTVKKGEFKELFVNKLLSDSDVKTIAVFMQDKLSLTEISLNGDVYSTTEEGGAFTHTKDLMTEYPSAFLSSVASPSRVFDDLEADFPGRHFVLQPPYNLANIQFDSAEKNLVVVQLPKQHGTGTGLSDYLHHIDNILNNVTYQLKALPGRFAAFYTGRKNQRQTPFEQHSGRQLLNYKESGNISGLILSLEDKFLMYAQNISLNYNRNKNHTELSIDPINWNISSAGNCPLPPVGNNTNSTDLNCTIYLHYNEEINLDEVTLKRLNLTMDFATSSKANPGYWYLRAFSMTYDNDTNIDPTTVVMDESFITWTPFKFSFHCYKNPPINAKKKKVPTATLR